MTCPRSFPLAWQLARLADRDSLPKSEDWILATVPGAVQLDWAKAKGLPDWNWGANVRAYDGLEDFFWLYSATIPQVDLAEGERLVLAGTGVDYHAEFRVEGKTLLVHTGLCTPFELDLTEYASGASLEILVHPAPKRPGSTPDRSEASAVTKPAVSYGWDWHPRLIPLGLSDEVRLEVRPARFIRDVNFRYELSPDFSETRIVVDVDANVPSSFTWRLSDPEGNVVIDSTKPAATLASPRLWWTHDHGEQNLYLLEVTLEAPGGSTIRRKVGFRRVRLVMTEEAWEHPAAFPKSRSHPPTTVELNGRRIFARGTNWVNPEIFHGKISGETYRPLLNLARTANFNLLRCWGGAPVGKESFFDLCDELGLLVWQEFPLACNAYPDDPAYLEDLDRESRAIIQRARQHPCLALWCGGNELFNAWSRMDDQSHALRLLNRNCFDLDRHTPFLPTAPVDGMGHGDYRFLDENNRDIFQIFQESSCTAYSEFGCPSISSVEYLKTFIPAEELWPPRPGTSWEVHHAFNSWSEDPNIWISTRAIEHYFGASETLEDLVYRGQWLQAEGYKSVFEEARRQSPRCAMALNWCFNEPWPTAANNSLLNYPAIPKPAFEAVREACRPALVSARIPKFQWQAGEVFHAEIWLLSDAPSAFPGGEVWAALVCGQTRTELLRWSFSGLDPQKNLPGPTVRAILPARAGEFYLEVGVVGREEWNSSYKLSMRMNVQETASSAAPRLNQ
jgi:beta-mannosidase